MKKPLLSVSQWKCLLIALTLYSIGLNLWSGLHWERFTVPGVAGTLAVDLGGPDRDYRLPILQLEPRSPLALAGARPGDTLVFDNAGDVWRSMAVDEAIGVTWYAAGQPHHAVLTAIPNLNVANAPHTAQLNYAMDCLFVWSALLLALLIGFRRAEDRSMRVFAILLACFSADVSTALPGGALQSFLVQNADPLLSWAEYVLVTYFALTFPQDESHWRLAWVRRLFAGYALLFTLVVAGMIAENHGALPPKLRDHLSPTIGKEFMAIASVLLSQMAIWQSWRRATGATRQRLAWIGVCLGMIYATYFVANLSLLFSQFEAINSPYLYIYSAAARPLAFAALGYALLRYRLFDFGFVVNRALVVTIISTLLLVVFAVTEWSVDKLLHFEGREKNVIFDAAVALAIILCFHRIQHWVNHQVNHTFFHHWYEATERLRQFLSKTAQITESQALLSKYTQALTEFSNASGIAIYLDQAAQEMVLCHSTLADAADSIDANHDVLIDLRHARQVVRLDAGSPGLPGELALPMMTQGRLRGLVLMGAKPNQQQFRPDEIALLAVAVQQLGMDLESLHAVELERQVGTLDSTAAHLEAQLAASQQQSTALQQAYMALERETALLRQLIHADGVPAQQRARLHNAP